MNKEQSVLAKKNKSWEVEAYVYLHSERPGDFTIESYLQTDPTGKSMEFYNRHHDGFWVTFYLVDETGLGYQFPDDDEDGIWSQMGGPEACPSTPIWDVFPKDKNDVKDRGMTLRAFNPNVEPAVGEFQYTLNVTKDGDKPYLPLDPGGTNHNGMTSRPDR